MKTCGCGQDLAGNARTCPNCGKRFTRPFVKALAISFGVVIVFGFISAAIVSNQPATKPPAAASSEPAIQSTPDQLAKAKKCGAFIKSDSRIKRYEWDGTHMDAEIGPTFYATDYGERDALNRLLLCVATDGRMDSSIVSVDYLDWRTHQNVGHWSPYTGLKFEDNRE